MHWWIMTLLAWPFASAAVGPGDRRMMRDVGRLHLAPDHLNLG
jgi:hypothetical protein